MVVSAGELVLDAYDSNDMAKGGSGTLGEANSTLYSTHSEPVAPLPVEVTWYANATASLRKFAGVVVPAVLMSVAVTSHFCFIALPWGTVSVASRHTGAIAFGDRAAVPWYVLT